VDVREVGEEVAGDDVRERVGVGVFLRVVSGGEAVPPRRTHVEDMLLVQALLTGARSRDDLGSGSGPRYEGVAAGVALHTAWRVE
jgi:hypothetical protein